MSVVPGPLSAVKETPMNSEPKLSDFDPPPQAINPCFFRIRNPDPWASQREMGPSESFAMRSIGVMEY